MEVRKDRFISFMAATNLLEFHGRTIQDFIAQRGPTTQDRLDIGDLLAWIGYEVTASPFDE